MMLRNRIFAISHQLHVHRRLSTNVAPVVAADLNITAESASNTPSLILGVRTTNSAGSRKSRKLRDSGLVPGVVHGVDDDNNVLKIMVTMDAKTLLREIKLRGRSFENTVYNAEVKDEQGQTILSYPVTPRQTQFCPLTERPFSVNFLRHLPTNRLRIPIKLMNSDQSVDIRRGCFVVQVSQYLECICDDEVPQSLSVDLSNAKKGEIYRVNSVILPPKVRPAQLVPPDLVLCVIKSAKK